MLRAIYIALLRLHPCRFRQEFAEEMLWIFDQAKGTLAAIDLIGDALRSVATQWMFRSEFDEALGLVPIAGPAMDRVPSFYTTGSEIPPPAALVNGLIGSFLVFALASFALMHSGGGGRAYTFLSNDFRQAPPGNGGDNVTGSVKVPEDKSAGIGNPAAGPPAGVWAKITSLFEKPPGPPAPGSPGEPRQQPPQNALPSAIVPGTGSDGSTRGTLSPEQALRAQQLLQARVYFEHEPILFALDANRDGVISAEEMASAPAVLLMLDKNHDGKLSPEECGWVPPRAPSAEEWAKRKLTRRGVSPDRRQRFDRYDRNHDGVLSGDEFRDFMADLEQQAARRAQLNFMRTDPVLDALDINHDGEISASEIRNAVESLKALDRDHDGSLRLAEVVPEPVAREVAILFRLDVDFDGRISQAEMQNLFGRRARNLLEAADRNGDGFVTWDELAYEIRLRADLNHDGVVTWQEMMLARKSGVLYGPGREQRTHVRV